MTNYKELEEAIEASNYRKKCVEGLQIALDSDEIMRVFYAIDGAKAIIDMSLQINQGKTLKTLLGLSDKALEPLYTAAKGLLEQKRYEAAEAAFTFLTFLDGAQYCFWLGLGHAQTHCGLTDMAIASYSNAEKLSNDGWPHIHKANCFIAKGDLESALQALETAKSLVQEASLKNAIVERMVYVKNRAKR